MINAGAAKSRFELRAVALPLACVLIVLALLTGVTAPALLPRLYFLEQDSIALVLLIALLLAFSVSRPLIPVPRFPVVTLTARKMLFGAAAAAILLWAGTYLLFDNYPLSRDEQMAVFDMQVFRLGRLAEPLAPEWRHFAEALTPAFLLQVPDHAAWASSYMPGNAMLRALFGVLLDAALMNPVLAAAGAVATFDCARRLFPENAGAQAIAVLMYATSAQVLVTAMTPFAMTAHLAFNMIWLSFYLRGTRRAHAAAIATGFLAIGLHQIIFHPLFALPFIVHLRRRGQWRTALVYTACYTLFALFWILYPNLVAASAGLNWDMGPTATIRDFIAERIWPVLIQREAQTIALMQANLLRFLAWENLALAPLVILGFGAVRRGDGIARPLFGGIILTFAAMAFLLPYQGIGWGYRYLHGLIGNCALLAAYGWRDYSDRPQVRTFVLAATLATILVSIPLLMWQAERFVAPYARVNDMIAGIDADMVVIETDGPAFRIDEVRNRPDLENRPIRLAGHLLAPADIRRLCDRGTIAFVDARQMQALGLGFGDVPDSTQFQMLHQETLDHCS
jgi:hypothetical protein